MDVQVAQLTTNVATLSTLVTQLIEAAKVSAGVDPTDEAAITAANASLQTVISNAQSTLAGLAPTAAPAAPAAAPAAPVTPAA